MTLFSALKLNEYTPETDDISGFSDSSENSVLCKLYSFPNTESATSSANFSKALRSTDADFTVRMSPI